MFALLLFSAFSISQEECMVCSSTLQVVQLDQAKGASLEELQKVSAEICLQFPFLSVCAKIGKELDSVLPLLKEQSAGKVCARKLGLCQRIKKSQVVRQPTLAAALSEENGLDWCSACKAVVPIAARYGTAFLCTFISGPAGPICAKFAPSIVSKIIKYAGNGYVPLKACQLVRLC